MQTPRALDLLNVAALNHTCEAKVHECSAAIKAQIASGDRGRPNDTVRRLLRELEQLRADFSEAIRREHLSIGVSEAEFEALDRAIEAQNLPPLGHDYWHHQIHQIRPTEDFDAAIAPSLEQLLGRVDTKWLQRQAEVPYRLGPSFLTEPLHVVNNIRVSTARDGEVPQRFARMLLLCQDHLNKEWNLDFFSLATFASKLRCWVTASRRSPNSVRSQP
jgi:hypothetical protein